MMTDTAFPAGQAGTTFPKRFYKTASVVADANGHALLLDGRPARTPARNPVRVPTSDLAMAIADEWAAVETVIDPRDMPITRLTNSVIDGVSRTSDAVREEIVRYAGSDLLAYRASEPDDLVAIQRRAWDPVLAWARERFGIALMTGEGVMFIAQPSDTEERVKMAVAAATGTGPGAPFRLGALHVMTTLTGSTLLALAVAGDRLRPDQAWSAAHVDEDFQIAQWGADEEASHRRALRWTEMRAAAQLLALSPP